MELLQREHKFKILSFNNQIALNIIKNIMMFDETKKYYKMIGRDVKILRRSIIDDLDKLNSLIN